MISYVKGMIIHKLSSSVVVLCGAVGYEVQVPATRLMQYGLQQEIEFYTYYHQREDSVQLFGFDSWEEREFFMTLINVSGIGPKGALAILGQSTLLGLYQAIASENVAFLTKVPGIGKKTAQRLVLELKDKLPKHVTAAEFAATLDPHASVQAAQPMEAIMEVLLALGYHENEVRRIYPQLMEDPDADEQALVKKALRLLARM